MKAVENGVRPAAYGERSDDELRLREVQYVETGCFPRDIGLTV
jgi:hypothetical protein